MHGAITGVFKNQIDWIPLSLGAVRPTQGRTLAVMQVCGGSQSFNVVNTLRLLGRWMRMLTIPNQSSVAKAYEQFHDDGLMKDSPQRDRVVDVMRSCTSSRCSRATPRLPRRSLQRTTGGRGEAGARRGEPEASDRHRRPLSLLLSCRDRSSNQRGSREAARDGAAQAPRRGTRSARADRSRSRCRSLAPMPRCRR